MDENEYTNKEDNGKVLTDCNRLAMDRVGGDFTNVNIGEIFYAAMTQLMLYELLVILEFPECMWCQ